MTNSWIEDVLHQLQNKHLSLLTVTIKQRMNEKSNSSMELFQISPNKKCLYRGNLQCTPTSLYLLNIKCYSKLTLLLTICFQYTLSLQLENIKKM